MTFLLVPWQFSMANCFSHQSVMNMIVPKDIHKPSWMFRDGASQQNGSRVYENKIRRPLKPIVVQWLFPLTIPLIEETIKVPYLLPWFALGAKDLNFSSPAALVSPRSSPQFLPAID